MPAHWSTPRGGVFFSLASVVFGLLLVAGDLLKELRPGPMVPWTGSLRATSKQAVEAVFVEYSP